MSTQHISFTKFANPGAMKTIILIMLLTSFFIVKPTNGLGTMTEYDGFQFDSVVIDKTNSHTSIVTQGHLPENVVEIPDTAFLTALIDVGVDTNGDSLISYNEAESVISLDVSGTIGYGIISRDITSLEGIEAFINLDTLNCYANEIQELDLSSNSGLRFLNCSYNEIHSLDISNCLLLEVINVHENQLSSLDVSKYSALTDLDCGWNLLSALDISDNNALTDLCCSGDPITSLNVSYNTALEILECNENQLTSLNVSKNIALTFLNCGGNQITSLDVSKNIALTFLNCDNNQLSSLDVSKNTVLEYLNISFMPSLYEVCVWTTPFPPQEVEVQKSWDSNAYFTTDCSYESIVYIPDTAFLFALIDEGVDTNGDGLISYNEAEAVTELDVSGESYSNTGNISNLSGIEAFINLNSLNCSLNELTSLDLSFNSDLTYLNCRSNQITSLDISNNTALTSLVCWDNRLTTLDVSNNTDLDSLDCSINNLTSLDVSKNSILTYLDLDHNQITNLDISNNTALAYLSCWYNQRLTSLDVSNNTALTYLNLYYNKISSLDVSNNTALESLTCARNQLSSLDISNNTALLELWCSINLLTSLDISNNTALTLLRCGSNQLTSLDVSNNVALIELSCPENQLNSLYLSNNTALKELTCYGNALKSLDISNNTALEYLVCNSNQLSSLDVSNNTELQNLRCHNNQLTSLDISKNVALTGLNCRENSLTSLDVSKNTSLTALDCSNNKLTSLDVTANINLSGSYHAYGGFSPGLYCSDNQITSLDISKNTDLYAFDCHNNQLGSLDISNNINLSLIDLSSMTSLGEVCVWESFAADSSADSGGEMEIITEGSTGICFQTDCNGICHEGIILSVPVDTIYQPMNIEAISSADGKIYLVPVDTDMDIQVVRGASMDSVEVVMNIPVTIPLEGLENGTYWLYATDTSENISEPMAFTIMGVGITQRDSENLRIYPNPANNLLTIETITLDLMNVTITSMNGQLMLDSQLEGTSHQLDLSCFQKGVYFITIRSKDLTTTRKIVKL